MLDVAETQSLDLAVKQLHIGLIVVLHPRGQPIHAALTLVLELLRSDKQH